MFVCLILCSYSFDNGEVSAVIPCAPKFSDYCLLQGLNFNLEDFVEMHANSYMTRLKYVPMSLLLQPGCFRNSSLFIIIKRTLLLVGFDGVCLFEKNTVPYKVWFLF